MIKTCLSYIIDVDYTCLGVNDTSNVSQGNYNLYHNTEVSVKIIIPYIQVLVIVMTSPTAFGHTHQKVFLPEIKDLFESS